MADHEDATAGGLWKAGFFRLFMSHSSQQVDEVRELKRELQQYGIDGFVAHEDIEPTQEWLDVIEEALKTCDALVAYLSLNFETSPWTNQEVGYALGREILVISIDKGKAAYGFMGKYQHLSGTGKSAERLAKDLFDCLISHPLTREGVTSASGMARTIHQGLLAQASDCRVEDGRIVPCRYHSNRVSCSALKLREDAILRGPNGAGAHLGPGIRAYFDASAAGRPAAGGWYLVHEHRVWLEKQLVWFLSQRRDRPVHILEAGVAGAVHHYTYVSIIAAACRAARYEQTIKLTVVDRCALPIATIKALESGVKNKRWPALAKKRIDVGGVPVPVQDDLREILRTLHPFLVHISTHAKVADLRRPDVATLLGSVDIVTEHFLTSFLDGRNQYEIEAVRSRYEAVLP
jgi:nucleoside 2-deoxyribosyltransferase